MFSQEGRLDAAVYFYGDANITVGSRRVSMTGPPIQINLGCGLTTPPGWVNVDGSPNAWLVRHRAVWRLAKLVKILPADSANVPWNPDILLHDVSKSLPFASDSADAVYASHLLEHLHLEEGKSLLKECFRVIKPGGVLRMVVPNLRADLLEYLGNNPN